MAVEPDGRQARKPKLHPTVLGSSLQRTDWPEILVLEGRDNGGGGRAEEMLSFRAGLLLGGDVETWWKEDGVARWRRAGRGALSVGPPTYSEAASWKGDRHFVFADISTAFMGSALPGENLRPMLTMRDHTCLHEYYAGAARAEALITSLWRLMDVEGSGMQAEEIGIELARWFMELAVRRPISDPVDGLSRVQLRRVVERIDAGLSGPMTLRELADVAQVSPFHFCRMFKRNTGLSPWQFVLRWRVERAAQLMRSAARPNLTVVAAACGFVDQSHLTRVFKRSRGVTPGEFVRRHWS